MFTVQQYTNRAPNVQLKKLLPDEYSIRLNAYKSAKLSDKHDRDRGIRNMRAYLSLDFDQWPDDVSEILRKEGQAPKTYNIIQKHVNGLAGNYIANWFDPKFVDREDDGKNITSTIYKVNRIYYADKDAFNYKSSAMRCIENGLIYRGVEELNIYRCPDEPRGRIRFENIRPDSIIFDPNNLTDNISRNSQECWKECWLTAGEAIQIFPHAKGEILQKLKEIALKDASEGEKYDDTTVAHFITEQPKLGNKMRFIEHYHLEQERQPVCIDCLTGTVLPETEYELGSEEDFMQKQIWAAQKGITLDPEAMTVADKMIPVLYVTTFCEDLNAIVENRKDERQLNGHLPFYCWSYRMKYGKSCGAVDFVFDAQFDINAREAAKTKALTQTPINGKMWYHPEAFGGDDKKIEHFIETVNDSSIPIELDGDAPPNSYGSLFGMMPGNQINSSVMADEPFKISLLDSIVNLPPAMQGFTERSGESALLLGRKVIEGSVAHRLTSETILQHEKDKAVDWFIMATKIYGGRNEEEKLLNRGREFHSGGGERIEINTVIGTDENGAEIVENDISELKRVDVIVSQAKENDYQKQAKLEVDAMILKTIPPTPTNGVIYAAFINDFVKSQTYEDDEQREKAHKAADVYYAIEMGNAKLAIENQKMQANQMQMQAQQAMMAAQNPALAQAQAAQTQPQAQQVQAPTAQQMAVA
jgi:hypothetical protein